MKTAKTNHTAIDNAGEGGVQSNQETLCTLVLYQLVVRMH